MRGATPTLMTDAEIEEFLSGEGTGVLSFAAENDSYSVPVSYGYDSSEPVFYFQLELSVDSEKASYVDTTETASFVVYNRLDGEWKSVVARGNLESVSEAEIDRGIAVGLQRGDAPLAAMFSDRTETLSFRIHRLAVSELTGRKAPAER